MFLRLIPGLGVYLLAPLVLTGVLPAQPMLDVRQTRQALEPMRSPDLRVDVNLVLLPVIVTNRLGDGQRSDGLSVHCARRQHVGSDCFLWQ